jgi:hypothetical protein
MRSRLVFVTAGAVLAGALTLPSPSVSASDRKGSKRFSARLQGFNEVPSISGEATGSFRARLGQDGLSLDYRLSYSGLSSTVAQAHIHLGQRHTNGGVMVFLCSGTSVDPTGLAPVCPQEGTVEGTLTADNIIGPAGQGVTAGEFEELVDALRKGAAYANVHTADFPTGEIRGHIQ